jgi:hypothetical protein
MDLRYLASVQGQIRELGERFSRKWGEGRRKETTLKEEYKGKEYHTEGMR